MSTIPSVDLGMAAFSGIASANISIAVPVLSQNLCHAAIPDSRTGAACVWRSAVGALTPTFPTRLQAFPSTCIAGTSGRRGHVRAGRDDAGVEVLLGGKDERVLRQGPRAGPAGRSTGRD